MGVWGEFSVYPTTDSVCELVVDWYVACDVSCVLHGLCRLDFDAGRVLPSRLLSPSGWGAMHPLPVVVLRVCLGAITAGRLFSL